MENTIFKNTDEITDVIYRLSLINQKWNQYIEEPPDPIPEEWKELVLETIALNQSMIEALNDLIEDYDKDRDNFMDKVGNVSDTFSKVLRLISEVYKMAEEIGIDIFF